MELQELTELQEIKVQLVLLDQMELPDQMVLMVQQELHLLGEELMLMLLHIIQGIQFTI
jgi:hypothetical protein